MADFIDGFWPLYVAGLIAFGLVFCIVILLANITARQTGEPKLQGHVWDETLREYSNPLPSWWLILFWVTVLFAIFYLFKYPGFGSHNSDAQSNKGLIGEYKVDDAKAQDKLKSLVGTKSVEELSRDPVAVGVGAGIFLNNCAQCHGRDAEGSKGKFPDIGYPNLADTDWLMGGDGATIEKAILDGRKSTMTAFPTISETDLDNVTQYVLQLSGQTADTTKYDAAKATAGKAFFDVNCLACHGADGKGEPLLGGPNLTDKIWLYENSVEAFKDGIKRGRNTGDANSIANEMPAWRDILGEQRVKLVAAYVYSLSSHAPAPAVAAPAQ